MSILTEPQLADKLKLSKWTVRRFRIKEDMPYIKVGKRIFYDPEAVYNWFKLNSCDCNNGTYDMPKIS